MRHLKHPRALPLLAALALTLPLGLTLHPRDAQACEDESRLCVDTANAKWEPDKTMSQSALKRERKKNKSKPTSNLHLTIEGGRASVFLDGRYVDTAPLKSYEIEAGKHDIQVRDGDIILAEGVLRIPSKTDVRITVVHP
ncbi:MAG: hypothetical protein H6713_37535 [Myxococcales bacterium]|nr:hypothetical protein [Myxococcales bacterium]